MGETELSQNIVEPFSSLYGPFLKSNHIAQLVAKKKDIKAEMMVDCTFTPQLYQSAVTERLARKRYEKDSANLSPTSSRIETMYKLGGKSTSPSRGSPNKTRE